MSRITITPHAKMRRKQMKVTEDQIAAVVEDPEMTYRSDPHHPEGRVIYQRGPLVVVVNSLNQHVITVFWHLQEGR